MNAKIKILVLILVGFLCIIFFTILNVAIQLPTSSMGFITILVLFNTLYSTKGDEENYDEIIIEVEQEVDIDGNGNEIIEVVEEIDETDQTNLAKYQNIIRSKTENRSREFFFQLKIAGIAVLAGILISMGIEAIFTIIGWGSFTSKFDHYLRNNLIIIIIIEICLFLIGLWLRKIAISKQKNHIPFS